MRSYTCIATIICLLLTADLAGGTAPSQQAAWSAYQGSLAKNCPHKHLEMLAPGVLIGSVEKFTDSLPPNKKAAVEASMERSCRGISMGASCSNIGFLQAAFRLGELDHFVANICALHKRCKDYADCTETE